MNPYLKTFDLQTALKPVWEGSIAYQESFWPVCEKGDAELQNGMTVRMLYPITEILQVQNYGMNQVFTEGKDYELRNGDLWIPANSAIQLTPHDYFNPETEPDDPFKIKHKDGGYVRFANTHAHTDRQYLITYRHTQMWDGVIPTCPAGALPLFHEKLKAKKPFNFGYFGDSITTGCNVSGWCNIPPFMPMWPEMVHKALEQTFRVPMNYINKAVGGKSSLWGVENAETAFAEEVPDICVVAFGMNDGAATAEEFERRIRALLQKLDGINPKMEYIVVSTTLPAPYAIRFSLNQAAFEPVMRNVVRDYGNRAVLVPITSIHAHLMNRKDYRDMTGNNVNHPNDYLARVYAQAILASVL